MNMAGLLEEKGEFKSRERYLCVIGADVLSFEQIDEFERYEGHVGESAAVARSERKG